MNQSEHAGRLPEILGCFRLSDLLIVSDLDDTLLNSEHALSGENRRAIEKLIRLGGNFGIASGRPVTPVRLLGVPTNYPSVLYNGSAVYDLATDAFLWTMPLPDDIRDLLLDLMERFPGMGIEIVMQSGYCILVQNAETDVHLSQEHVVPAAVVRTPADAVGSIMKIILAWPGEKLKDVERYIRQLSEEGRIHYNFGFSYPILFELLHPDANKGLALRQLSAITGIPLSNIIALGDNMNDLELMQTAGIRIVPSNAVPAIRALAEYISVDNDHHIMEDVLSLLLRYCKKD